MANKKGTLYVITCFEKSRDYLFSALDNASKKYRYSFVRKIEQMLLDIDECLRMANRTRLEMEKERVGFQEKQRGKSMFFVLFSVLQLSRDVLLFPTMIRQLNYCQKHCSISISG